MKLPNRRKDAELDLAAADQMLVNVFRACEVEPNTVPLQTLTGYSRYRRERFNISRILIGIIIAVFQLLPLLFVPASVSVEECGTEDGIPTFSVSVNSIIPVLRVSAMVDGRNVPVNDNGSHQYTVQPTRNGEMTVTVVLFNGQKTEETVTASGADTDAPVITETTWDDGFVYLTAVDEGSGVRFDSVYLKDEDGVTSEPYAVDEETGVITLLYPQIRTEVYISDNAGNVLHLSITPEE